MGVFVHKHNFIIIMPECAWVASNNKNHLVSKAIYTAGIGAVYKICDHYN